MRISLLFIVLAFLIGCDDEAPPRIVFKQDAGFISSNATVAKNSLVRIGIEASKTEKKDPLKKFTIIKRYEDGSEETIEQLQMTTPQGNNFTYSRDFTTRNQPGNETYLFIITSSNDLVSQVSLTLSVLP